MKFALNNKDVDSIKADLPDGTWFELKKLNVWDWALLGHWDNQVSELITLNDDEWKVIWKMLTEE